MRDIDYYLYTFLLFTRFLRSSIVNIVSEKKVAYTSCCIVFEMNSCEFARTTIDPHSTLILFVRSEEQEQEMLSTSFNVTAVKINHQQKKKKMMIVNNIINSIKKRDDVNEE